MPIHGLLQTRILVDIGAKKRVYEAGGLPELWLVDDVLHQVFAFPPLEARRRHL